MNTVPIEEEKEITVLSISKTEFKGEDSKDSATGYWLLNINYLGKAITTKANNAQILVNNFSEKFIKTGRYIIDSKKGPYGYPLFKFKAVT